MLVDQKTEQAIVPLNDNLNATGKLELANSVLSFFGLLVTYVTLIGFRPGSLSEMAVLAVNRCVTNKVETDTPL